MIPGSHPFPKAADLLGQGCGSPKEEALQIAGGKQLGCPLIDRMAQEDRIVCSVGGNSFAQGSVHRIALRMEQAVRGSPRLSQTGAAQNPSKGVLALILQQSGDIDRLTTPKETWTEMRESQ